MKVGQLDLPARLECVKCGWIVQSKVPNLITSAFVDGQMTLRIDILPKHMCNMCNEATAYRIVTDETD